ncbi:MAG: SDR family NAD(P)-dependent oxidoreductase [Chlamydiae bacterium]|nr:SDR family NAD(P)-dependent oxidoreductase [Chlamydiota bacterium]MBI3278179.1 SDR family NAD(P)-dependent oxidoreductase [Chlamydiota bacterium]
MKINEIRRTILITGASRGLGAELVQVFAGEADQVIGLYRQSDSEVKILSENAQMRGQHVQFFKVNIGDSKEVKFFFAFLKEEGVVVDVLINNAAITRDQNVILMKSEDWDEVMQVNLKGPIDCIQGVLPLMESNPSQERNFSKHIINIISRVAMTGNRGQSNYAVSKAALLALTKVAALELRSKNIQVNAVIPGLLPTRMTEGMDVMRNKSERSLRDVAESIRAITELHAMTGEVFSLEDRVFNY